MMAHALAQIGATLRRVRMERGLARLERSVYRSERAEAIRQRDEALVERDSLERSRNEARAERDTWRESSGHYRGHWAHLLETISIFESERDKARDELKRRHD